MKAVVMRIPCGLKTGDIKYSILRGYLDLMSDSKDSEDRKASTLQLPAKKLHAGSLLGKKTATNLNLLRVGPEYLSMANQSIDYFPKWRCILLFLCVYVN